MTKIYSAQWTEESIEVQYLLQNYHNVAMMIMKYWNSRTFKELPLTSNSKTFKTLVCSQGLFSSPGKNGYFLMDFRGPGATLISYSIGCLIHWLIVLYWSIQGCLINSLIYLLTVQTRVNANRLKATCYCYNTKKQISHIFYAAPLKLRPYGTIQHTPV